MKLFKRVDKVLAKHDAMEADIRRRDGVQPLPEIPIPAGALIATRTGTVGHRKSALRPGARCEALSEWMDWRIASDDEGLKPCHRCELAGQERAAS
jgi:hypothetical protein